jgi:hypothetical protein
MLSVGEEKDGCAYKEQHPGASQQNTANYFSLLWGKPTSQRCVGDILSSKKKLSICCHPRFNANTDGDESAVL